MQGAIEKTVKDVLSSPVSEVLSIKGAWGVGKTYWWKSKFRSLIKPGRFDRYSYVSLFGVENLKDLEFKIFQEAVALEGTKVQQKSNKYISRLVPKISECFRRRFKTVEEIEVVKKYLPDLKAIALSKVNNYLICLDDFERKGKELGSDKVMGLISYLKEEKDCTVVLILNEDEIDKMEDGDKNYYYKYKEKVIGVEVKFEMIPEDAAMIALSTRIMKEYITKYVCKIGVTNIRIIQKIDRISGLLEPCLNGYDHIVIDAIARTTVILCWSYYTKDLEVPNFEFILRFYTEKTYFSYKGLSVEEKEWCEKIDACGVDSLNEVDFEIVKILRKGIFDEKTFSESLEKTKYVVDARRRKEDLFTAIDTFWNCLECNQEEALELLFRKFGDALPVLEMNDLESVVYIYQVLEQEDMVEKCINKYLYMFRTRKDKIDWRGSMYGRYVKNETIKKEFDNNLFGLKPTHTLNDVFSKIIQREECDADDIMVLYQSDEGSYLEILAKLRGSGLKIIVLFFVELIERSDVTTEESEIHNKAISALKTLAGQCKINEVRLSRYGITVQR